MLSIYTTFTTMSCFFAFFTSYLCCFMMKKKKTNQEMEVVNVEDHVHVHEAIVQGPQGQQVVALDVQEDIKMQEEIKKSERLASASVEHVL
ncbi:hypothetical protein J5N97_020067 [Dioscorea zingiberensis]|uniref:Uncharacterized protein n=1 Tax=Dioscorea zingiberensis TaxID=325984 RepID=A0A9D5HDG7_9LILI|nr:hypothetical protein J5N97_020067 [Dioscorea zingiberensis]